VQGWAKKFGNPDFTLTPEEYEALALSARYIGVKEVEADDGTTKTAYTDTEGKSIPESSAKVVLAAAEPTHHEESASDEKLTDALLGAGGINDLKASSPDAYSYFEGWCVRSGRAPNSESLQELTEVRQKRRVLTTYLREKADAESAGVEDLAHDRLVRSLGHLVTRVVPEDSAEPDQNLQAEMDTVNHDTGAIDTIALSDRELERIEDLAPEIKAGIKLKEKTPEEIADERWLMENQAEIIQRRRVTYALNGRVMPTKGWKEVDLDTHNPRVKWFDKLTLEQKLGLEPLPDRQTMPPITILTPAPKKADYSAPETPPTRGGLVGFVPALVRNRGKNTREVLDVVGTGIAGPVIRGGVAAVRYATGVQHRAEKAENDAREADIDALVKASRDASADVRQRVELIRAEMERTQYLEKTVRDIANRRAGREVKQKLAVNALDHVLNGRDPARELATDLKTYRLSIADLLPGFDLDRRKRYKKDKSKSQDSP
jgi:hypothetical protein